MSAHHAWQANVAKARATFKARLARSTEAERAEVIDFMVKAMNHPTRVPPEQMDGITQYAMCFLIELLTEIENETSARQTMAAP